MIPTTTSPTAPIPDPPDPRRYWLRAHQHAVAHARRASTTSKSAWQSGQPARLEWEQLRAADRHAAYCYARLCATMGW